MATADRREGPGRDERAVGGGARSARSAAWFRRRTRAARARSRLELRNRTGYMIVQLFVGITCGSGPESDQPRPGGEVEICHHSSRLTPEPVPHHGRPDAPRDRVRNVRRPVLARRAPDRHRAAMGAMRRRGERAERTNAAHRTVAVRWHRVRSRAHPDGGLGHPGRGGSGRQPSAALEPAGPHDGTAGTGGHAMPEAVALGPAAIVGLVRTLHSSPPGRPASCGAPGGMGVRMQGDRQARPAAHECALNRARLAAPPRTLEVRRPVSQSGPRRAAARPDHAP
jgi:hypothetical protein